MRGERVITTRRTLLTGMASCGGLLLAGCSDSAPPTYGNLLRIADNLNYRAQRLLLPRNALVREYQRADITSIAAIGTTNPANPHEELYDAAGGAAYDRLRHGDFADWRLTVDGSVSRPASFSLEDLRRMATRTQITKHTCEEGWSAIAEWTGVPLRTVLQSVGVRPSARFVNFYAFDATVDSIDMVDALHPQTLLAYGMNGGQLPVAHGAPLRVRVERQLGYKSIKFLHRIRVTDEFYDPGKLGPLQQGWAWYTGI